MTLDEALRVLMRESLGDFIYTIRERVLEDGTFKGSTWDHPRVRAWGEACKAIGRHVASLPEET